MTTPATTDPSGSRCDASTAAGAPSPPVPTWGQQLFPPKDADLEARRRWLAASPWPEVVFAAAV